jgi:hypothetical protein
MSVDRDGFWRILISWLLGFLFITGVLLILASFVLTGAAEGKTAYLGLGFAGFLVLLGAGAIDRMRRIQAEPDRRARRADLQRLRREGLLVSQPDLARELAVKSPTVRRWCQTLGLEPACRARKNYYTLAQADLIRQYGIAGVTKRREILEELKVRPLKDRTSECTACRAWNPPGSQQCGECGAALESAKV